MGDWWVPYASWATAVVAIVVAVLVKSPVVPRSRLADLLEQITILEGRIERLEEDNKDLQEDNRRLRRDNLQLMRMVAKLDQNGTH